PPPPPPPPAKVYTGPFKTISASDRHARYSLRVPRNCVAPGQSFTATLKSRRKTRVFRRLSRVDFYLEKKRLRIDRKAPFAHRYKVAATQRSGSTIKLRARAFIKLKRGKTSRKTLRATVKIC
ncbi:MAG: hypothetical protein M3N47_11780, partial [Chloroflexota bacterium]|nr:hypothetical protein [Chloroflexota bacterium]